RFKTALEGAHQIVLRGSQLGISHRRGADAVEFVEKLLQRRSSDRRAHFGAGGGVARIDMRSELAVSSVRIALLFSDGQKQARVGGSAQYLVGHHGGEILRIVFLDAQIAYLDAGLNGARTVNQANDSAVSGRACS